jgi:glucose-6-phosphate 1-epimerase
MVRAPAGSYRIESDARCALVWNAGDNDRNIPDMGQGNHRGYACVERGDMADGVLIEPGQAYRCAMALSMA